MFRKIKKGKKEQLVMLAVPESWVRKAAQEGPRRGSRSMGMWASPRVHSRGATSRTLQISNAISARIPGPPSPTPRLDPWPQPHPAVSLALYPVTHSTATLPAFIFLLLEGT